ncbi:MAG: hypothetical protein K8R85_10000 [Bacteroidetes bacterium]|nr:hypothetical protein [Bacteroidota bacterium]
MKKVISIFLFGIFLFNMAGYFIAFKSFQYQVKKEIKAEIKKKINPNELTIIVIDKKQINKIDWLEKGKEMYYHGKLYDIVRHTENDTSITYYCINDKQEELLFANLEEHIAMHIAANKPIKNQTSKKLANNVIKLYFSNEQSIKFNTVLLNSPPFYSINLSYKSSIIETDTPPPEFV